MLEYNIDKLSKFLFPIIGTINSCIPVGNHELKRHLVYKLSCCKNEYIIKLYYKKNRWNNEIACLNHLKDCDIPIPEIVDYGLMDDDTEWLLYRYVPGAILQDISDKIPHDNLVDIYQTMGESLAKIHNHGAFKYFGRMDINGDSLTRCSSFKEKFISSFDRFVDDLSKEIHDEQEVISSSINAARDLFPILDDNIKPMLCHHDYGPRNILVNKVNGKYEISCIIDFEQSSPDDIDKELVYVMLPLTDMDTTLYHSFKIGYESISSIDMKSLDKKKILYNLYGSLGDCSWAKETAYDYYLNNLAILKNMISLIDK